MQDLIKHEEFEIEVLDRLNSGKLLQDLVFGGGTMLRLCHGLNRYSVDLDFWFLKESESWKYFNNGRKILEEKYTIKDAQNKHYTILYEISSSAYPRSLKIEIRKEVKDIRLEDSIAYSKYSNVQVLLKTVSLNDMLSSKIDAFLDRGEIRDCYDIEFLVKKGIQITPYKDKFDQISEKINSLTKKDYNVKLGSILDSEERKYYRENNFKILKSFLNNNATGL